MQIETLMGLQVSIFWLGQKPLWPHTKFFSWPVSRKNEVQMRYADNKGE